MALSPGTRLGVYQITAHIGEGGMGEVYRARDTTLDRDVAIKILPTSFASDPDRLMRFEREAKTLAALNHPHIAQIYGFEQAGGTSALVMELVDGEDLSKRIAQGAIPLADALPIAKQIADALEAAHEQGIVHRDLKPANVKIRVDGTVKVLDFGLAKALAPAGTSATTDATDSPTMTSPAMTAMGIILGTAAYMSPEQAKGRAVDKRADIWAFGVVLHEMLTGRRLFDAEDISETLAAVLTRDVSLSSLPAETSPRLRALVRNCLVRDPRQRLRDIGDARIVLEKIIAGTPDEAPAATETAGVAPASSRVLPWTVAGTLAVALGVAVWAPWRVEKSIDRPLMRLDVDLGAETVFPSSGNSITGSNIAISPDGTRLVYAGGTPVRLFTRLLDQPNANELPGTQGAIFPFFSHDGQTVGFSVNGQVKQVSVNGGGVLALGEVTTFGGGSWAEDGSLVVSEPFGRGLLQFPVGGGSPKIVAPHGTGEVLVFPQYLPGGKAVLFAACKSGGPDNCNIEVLTLTDTRRKILVRGGDSPHYVPSSNGTGYLLYLNLATLFAIPFDPATLETRGTAVRMLDDVGYAAMTGASFLDVSGTGTLIYRKSRVDSAMTTLQWIDPSGKREPFLPKPAHYGNLNPMFAPDGRRIALTIREPGNEDVWVYDSERGGKTRVTFGGANLAPLWSDDQHIVFARLGQGMFQARADGATPPQLLMASKTIQLPWSFRPDGKWLAYFEPAPVAQIWTVPVENQGGQLVAGKPEQFLKTSFQDSRPAFSPDGRWLAYISNESGTEELYVRPFPPPSSGQEKKYSISNNGAATPHWSRTGHELIYRSGDQLMTISWSVNGEEFVHENPRVWIAKLGGTAWELSPDGKRVVVLIPETTGQAPEQEHGIVMLLNFADELRRQVPAR